MITKNKLLEKGVSVKCETETEVKIVLKTCENLNIKWIEGQTATKCYLKKGYPKIINIDSNGISTCHVNDHYASRYSLCTVNDFIENLVPPKQEIHITRKENKVHAILKENGKVVKRTVAKCHPEDEFDFKVGSRIAYDRLFEKDENVETNKSKHEFKVGDKVRIRQWDDMAEEFGVDKDGDVKIPYPDLVVSANFKHLCVKTGKIVNIENDNIYFKPFDGTDIFCYLPCILEPYAPRVAKVGEYVRILKSDKIVKCDHDTEYNGEKIFKCDEGDCVYLKPEEYEVLDNYAPLLNCRFIPTEDMIGLTKGQIYEVKNGKFEDDGGSIFPMTEEILNEETLKKYFRPLCAINIEGSEAIIIIKD